MRVIARFAPHKNWLHYVRAGEEARCVELIAGYSLIFADESVIHRAVARAGHEIGGILVLNDDSWDSLRTQN